VAPVFQHFPKFLCGLLVFLFLHELSAQDKISQTPSLIQVGFGPGGFDLVGDGSAFCGPTTVTMSLAYLASAGFTQILPTNPGFADYLQLERNMVGLSGATQLSGATGDGLQTAVSTFLSAKGISNASFNFEANPDVAWFTSQIPLTYSSSFLNVGWYTRNSDGTYSSNGGHFIGVTATNLSAIGVSGSDYLVLSNPAPITIFKEPDVPSSNPQFAHTIAFTGTISGGGPAPVIQFDYHQPGASVTRDTPGLIQEGYTVSIDPSELPTVGWTPSTWVLTSTTSTINTGGGDLVVLAPIAGDGGVQKGGGGTLYLTAGSNTSTGLNSVSNGGINSNQTTGTPLGTGSVLLQNGTLTLQPTLVSPSADISLTLASGSNSRLRYTGGGVLALDPNGNNSLTVTIGDTAHTVSENFTGTTGGTLVIAPGTGNASLGSTVKVLLAGSGTLEQHNGMISPAVIAQDSNATNDGDFLTYGSTNGFTVAAYTFSSSVAINSGTSTTVYNTVTDQTLAADSTAELHALRVENSTISSGGGTTSLRVGSGLAADYAGLILNGGQIQASDLDFRDAEGMIYTSKGGGLISSTIHTTSGLTLFGPGNLTLTGASTYTGGTRVQSGTLTVKNITGSALGSGHVDIAPMATVVVSGSQARIDGAVTVQNGAVLTLLDGSIGGVTVDPLGSLNGHGHITGTADINGTVGISGTSAGILSFEGATTFEGNSIYQWTLTSLTASGTSGGVAGVDWNYVEFHTSDPVILGTSTAAFNLDTNFTLVDDPNSGNSFWDESHSWLLMKSDSAFTGEPNVYFGFPTFTQGSFEWDNTNGNTEIWLYYSPVPEPGTNALLGLGAGALIFFARRRSMPAPRIDRA